METEAFLAFSPLADFQNHVIQEQQYHIEHLTSTLASLYKQIDINASSFQEDYSILEQKYRGLLQ